MKFPGRGLLHADWQGRRRGHRMLRVVLEREGLTVVAAAGYVAGGGCRSSPQL